MDDCDDLEAVPVATDGGYFNNLFKNLFQLKKNLIHIPYYIAPCIFTRQNIQSIHIALS
jgi:hypothetical protein